MMEDTCKFCDRLLSAEEVQAHMEMRHYEHGVKVDGQLIPVCIKSSCMPGMKEGSNRHAHYHCPCGKTIRRKGPFEKHLKTSLHKNRQRQRKLADQKENTPSPASNDIISEKDKSDVHGGQLILPATTTCVSREVQKEIGHGKRTTDQVFPPPQRSREQTYCSECNTMVLKKNYRRHVNRRHKVEDSNILHCPSASVDSRNGIFMVAKSLKGEIRPIHVTYRSDGVTQVVYCDSPQCQTSHAAALRGNFKAHTCCHVLAVNHCQESCQVTEMSADTLSHKLLSRASKRKLEEFVNTLKSEGKIVAASWNPNNSSKVHISVYSNTPSQTNPGRHIVTFNRGNGKFTCSCTFAKGQCRHVQIATWHILELEPSSLRDVQPTEGDEMDSSCCDMASSLPLSSDADCAVDIPVTTEHAKMITYLQSKLYPPFLNQISVDSIDAVAPPQAPCPACSHSSSTLTFITKSAKMYDLTWVKTGITVYNRKCKKCNFQWHYQEYEQGMHNYDNKVFLSTNLCRFFRSCVQDHVAVGRAATILERMHGVSYPDNIFQMYLHFEAMTDHSYNFYCIRCGHSPPILIIDGHWKAAFDVEVSEIPVPVSVEDDKVSMDLWWQDVQKKVLLRPFVQDQSKITLEPSYQWAPYICPHSITDDKVCNTERKKSSMGPTDNSDDDDEQLNDPEFSSELTEEYLTYLHSHGTAKQVRKAAMTFGVSAKDSVTHIISRLREKAMKQSDFNKKFLQIYGRSGGVILACCKHRVTYGIKMPIRRESARDYFDLIQSFTHQPNIIISDISSILAKHGNKRRPGSFSPHDGRVAEPTEENIKSAKSGNFKVKMPKLTESEFQHIPPEQVRQGHHPITDMPDHLSLSDTFHFRNLKNPADVLRNTRCILELDRHTNTQAVEQNFQSFKMDTYWLNPMSPLQYAFTCRLLCHLRNETLNKRALQEIQASLGQGYDLRTGSDGRIFADKKLKNFVSRSLDSETTMNVLTSEATDNLKSAGTSYTCITRAKGSERKLAPSVSATHTTKSISKAHYGKVSATEGKTGNTQAAKRQSSQHEEEGNISRPSEAQMESNSAHASVTEKKFMTSNNPVAPKSRLQEEKGKATQTASMQTGGNTACLAGLSNPGTLCWLNSSVQSLCASLYHTISVVSTDHVPRWFTELQRLMHKLQLHNTLASANVFDTKTLAKSYADELQTPHIVDQQQDASEFVSAALQMVQDSSKMLPLSCCTQFIWQYLCMGSKCRGQPQDDVAQKHPVDSPCFAIPLRESSVQNNWNSFVNNTQEVENFFCQRCGERGKARERLHLISLPDILVFQLKRFNWGDDGVGRKVSKEIDINKTLTVTTSETLMEEASVSEEYQLLSVQCHVGQTMNCGHYYTLVVQNEDVVKANDDVVTKHDMGILCEQQVKTECYIVWYKKSTSVTLREKQAHTMQESALHPLPLESLCSSDVHSDVSPDNVSDFSLGSEAQLHLELSESENAQWILDSSEEEDAPNMLREGERLADNSTIDIEDAASIFVTQHTDEEQQKDSEEVKRKQIYIDLTDTDSSDNDPPRKKRSQPFKTKLLHTKQKSSKSCGEAGLATGNEKDSCDERKTLLETTDEESSAVSTTASTETAEHEKKIGEHKYNLRKERKHKKYSSSWITGPTVKKATLIREEKEGKLATKEYTVHKRKTIRGVAAKLKEILKTKKVEEKEKPTYTSELAFMGPYKHYVSREQRKCFKTKILDYDQSPLMIFTYNDQEIEIEEEKLCAMVLQIMDKESSPILIDPATKPKTMPPMLRQYYKRPGKMTMPFVPFMDCMNSTLSNYIQFILNEALSFRYYPPNVAYPPTITIWNLPQHVIDSKNLENFKNQVYLPFLLQRVKEKLINEFFK